MLSFLFGNKKALEKNFVHVKEAENFTTKENIATKTGYLSLNDFCVSSLILAAMDGRRKRVLQHLDKTNINGKDAKGWTALMAASLKGHAEIVQLLLDNGAEINAQSNDGITALIVATLNGEKEVIQVLLKNGVDVTIPTNADTTALEVASIKGHTEIAQILRRACAIQ